MKTKLDFGKILLPIVTPYNEDESVNYERYAELIEYLIKEDLCDSLIIGGTTGEATLLTIEERVKLFKVAVKAVNGRKPIIAGTGCASTIETISLTKKAYEIGIKAALVVCPYYNKPTQDGLYEHYKKLAESVESDIILYNIPIFTGVNIAPETVGKLSEISNIIGIKDEAGMNPTQVSDYFLATENRSDFLIYNGDDIMLLPTIVQGAMGIVSGGAHIFGHEIREIFNCFEKGENDKARSLFVELYKFCKVCGQGGRVLPNPIMRPAIELVTGIKIGPGRMPLSPITDEEMHVLKNTLKSVGKL